MTDSQKLCESVIDYYRMSHAPFEPNDEHRLKALHFWGYAQISQLAEAVLRLTKLAKLKFSFETILVLVFKNIAAANAVIPIIPTIFFIFFRLKCYKKLMSLYLSYIPCKSPQGGATLAERHAIYLWNKLTSLKYSPGQLVFT